MKKMTLTHGAGMRKSTLLVMREVITTSSPQISARIFTPSHVKLTTPMKHQNGPSVSQVRPFSDNNFLTTNFSAKYCSNPANFTTSEIKNVKEQPRIEYDKDHR